MRHSLQAKLLVFGLFCFLLTVGSSAIELTQFRRIAHNADRVQQQYDTANTDAASLREELIRLIARIKDVWLRGGKTDSIDAVAGLVEETWQTTITLRARLESDVTLTPTMRDILGQYDATMTDYRASYQQTLSTYRTDVAGPDGANADTRADNALKGKGLAASGIVGTFQDEVHAATAQVRADRRAAIATAERVTIAEAAALLAMIAAVGIWLVRAIGRGVGDVAAAATAVSHGAREITVPVRGKGELAQLAATFNAMVRELGSQERQLEELRRIAVALTAATTERAVCEIVVNGLADTFGYQYVSIYLIRPGDAGNLWLVHQRGYTTVIDPIPVGGTVTGRTVRERRPILVADARQDADFIAAEQQIVCEACAPLLAPDRVLGTLLLEEEEVGKLTEADLNLIATVANNVSVALENVRLNDEARTRLAHLARANRDLAAVMATGTRLAATLDLEAVVGLIADELRRVVDAPYLFVSTYIEGESELRVRLGFSGGAPTPRGAMPLDGTLSGWLIANRREVRLRSAAEVAYFRAEQHITSLASAPGSVIGLPLIAGAHLVGALTIGSATADAYTDQQLSVVRTIAAQAAIAINNALLYDQIQRQVMEMQRLNGELAAANTLKSDFLATMSHELRTPLNAIIGFSELLSDGIVTEPAEMQACLTDILSSGRHLLNLINDVLDISKIEAGRMELNPTAFDVREEVRAVVRSVAPLVAGRAHTLTVAGLDEEQPVYADRQRVRQILLNLVSNAIKFTPDGGTIAVTVGVDGPRRERVAIAVRDTGIGIRAEDFPKLFEKFRQLDAAHNRRYEGTGLGLALTRQLVELSGGAIGVTSAVGRGSTFTVTLPASHDAPARGALPDAVAAVAD